MKLFNSKVMVVIWSLSDGFTWEIHFDIDTGLYQLDCEKYFPDPIKCLKDFEDFAKENEIENYEVDWSNLK